MTTLFTHPVVAFFMLTLVNLGLYKAWTAKAGGMGLHLKRALNLAGSTLLLGLLVGSLYAEGYASLTELWILGGGIVALLIELLIIPGFGVVGLAGVGATLVGLTLVLLPGGDQTYSTDDLIVSLSVVGLLLLSTVIAFAIKSKEIAASPLMRAFVQDKTLTNAAGYVAHDPAPLIGQEGEVVATLRPSGKIRIGHEVVNAMSEGPMIDPGTRVRITGVSNGIYVISTDLEAAVTA